MSEFKVIENSDFGDIGKIFETFFNGIELKNDRSETCKITKNEAKQGVNKRITIHEKEINFTIPPKTKSNDIIVLKGQGNHFNKEEPIGDLYIKIHIFGDKTNRKGRIIYE